MRWYKQRNNFGKRVVRSFREPLWWQHPLRHHIQPLGINTRPMRVHAQRSITRGSFGEMDPDDRSKMVWCLRRLGCEVVDGVWAEVPSGLLFSWRKKRTHWPVICWSAGHLLVRVANQDPTLSTMIFGCMLEISLRCRDTDSLALLIFINWIRLTPIW